MKTSMKKIPIDSSEVAVQAKKIHRKQGTVAQNENYIEKGVNLTQKKTVRHIKKAIPEEKRSLWNTPIRHMDQSTTL